MGQFQNNKTQARKVYWVNMGLSNLIKIDNTFHNTGAKARSKS